jgi:hypothetical protein
MKQKDRLGIVPPQFTGQEIETASTQVLKTEANAESLYNEARKKLLDVNNWNKVAGIVTARFQIIDEKGKEVNREVKKGDYLRIDIPGPGSKEGDGYDWVFVEVMNEINNGSVQSAGFRVRPDKNPFGEKNETAHFYSKEATSSFIIIRENTKVISWIVDRNLLPNTESGSLVDKVRDVAIGISAIAGFSKVQWQGLADGLIKNANE